MKASKHHGSYAAMRNSASEKSTWRGELPCDVGGRLEYQQADNESKLTFGRILSTAIAL